jgi:D-alanyl-D-alanine carboxypeptidase
VRRLLVLVLVMAVLVAAGGLALVSGAMSLPTVAEDGHGVPSAGSSPTASAAIVSPAPSPSPSPSPLPSPTPVPTPPPLPATALQEAVDAWLASTGTPGVSVTIEWADGRTWTGVAGVADAKRGIAMTPDTTFPLASITKTFTSALVLRLVEEGRLALDQPVAPILTGLGLDPRITVRMLLDHTSGLPDIFSAPGIDRALRAAPDRRWTLADSLAYARSGRAVPGTRWAYSNTNYLLLGALLERVTGMTFAELTRSELFGPLGLGDSFVQVAEPATGPLAVGHVVTRSGSSSRATVVREGAVQPFTSVITAGGGADAIAASSADVARWAHLLYTGGVLDLATVTAMLDDVSAVARLKPSRPYGLGVEVSTIARFGIAYGHNGHLVGFQDLVRYLPGQGLSIAILSDSDSAPVARLLPTLLGIAWPLGLPCERCR